MGTSRCLPRACRHAPLRTQSMYLLRVCTGPPRVDRKQRTLPGLGRWRLAASEPRLRHGSLATSHAELPRAERQWSVLGASSLIVTSARSAVSLPRGQTRPTSPTSQKQDRAEWVQAGAVPARAGCPGAEKASLPDQLAAKAPRTRRVRGSDLWARPGARVRCPEGRGGEDGDGSLVHDGLSCRRAIARPRSYEGQMACQPGPFLRSTPDR